MSSQTFSMPMGLDPKEITAKVRSMTPAITPPAPKPVVIKIDTVEDAIRWRGWVESQETNPVQNLQSNDEDIFDLSNRIDAAEALLPTATGDEKRLILGYQERDFPSLPGIADSYHHVPGTIETLKAKREELERIRPALERKAQHFLSVVEALKAWPSWRISQLRNEANERTLIAKGKPIQKRGRQ